MKNVKNKVAFSLLMVSAIATSPLYSAHVAQAAEPSAIDQMDKFLRKQFPQKMSKMSEQDQTLVRYTHYSTAVVSALSAIATYQFDKGADARLKSEHVAFQRRVLERGEDLNLELARSSQQIEVLRERAATIEAFTVDPKGTLAPTLARMEEQLKALAVAVDRVGQERLPIHRVEQIILREQSMPQFLKDAVMKAALAPAKKRQIEALNALLQQQEIIQAEYDELRATGRLPEALVGKNGEMVRGVYAEIDATELKFKTLEAEKTKMDLEGARIAKEFRARSSKLRKAGVGVFKFVGVIGSAMVFSNSASAIYMADTLGRHPGLVPLYDVAMNTTPEDYENAVKMILNQ